MKITYSFKTAVRGLQAHKTRSALTILGIVIGISAIILIMSLGRGAQNLILGEIQALGSKTIAIVPGREPSGPTDPSVVESLLVDSLKDRELRALQKKENVPTLARIMPVLFGSSTAAYESETFRATIFGATSLAQELYDVGIASGSFFNDDDVLARADVAVIGHKVKNELFGIRPAVGEKIKINGRNFRVIGVMPKKGQVSFFNFDEIAFVPYTTAQDYIFGIKHYHRLIAEADSEANIARTVTDIEQTLRDLHNIEDPEKDDFFIETQEDLADIVGNITNILTLFLVAVASVSLLVGGVGIMNIMLVSVTERTREIGLRKALGAKKSDILTQFLFEAVMLTAFGGVIGIVFGGLLAFLVSFALSRFAGFVWIFVFPVFPALVGLSVSALIGLIFGLYPASSASKKSPMEALRYE